MSIFGKTEGFDADDPILGLAEEFRKDMRPQKVNLAIGSYKDAQGKSWVLPSVLDAEKQLASSYHDKEYLPIEGDPKFLTAVTELLLGKLDEELSNQVVTVQTIGGTSALRIAADYLRLAGPRTISMSDPTWPNHPNLCKQAGLTVSTYPYYNHVTKGLDFDALLNCLQKMQEGSALLLHVCCHNPTGIDLSLEQWQQVFDLIQEKKLFPLFDLAYQGFGKGIEEDVQPLREALRRNMECFIANSFSKNFGLYGERVGSLTALCPEKEHSQRLRKQLKTLIRRSYSSPQLHGEQIVTAILSSPALCSQWKEDVDTMRTRISSMRSQFSTQLQEQSDQDLSFLEGQNGLFSYGWLSEIQVERLKREFAIYLPLNGRLTIPGLTEENLSYVVHSLLTVTSPSL